MHGDPGEGRCTIEQRLTLVAFESGDKLKACWLQLQHVHLSAEVRYESILIGWVKREQYVKEKHNWVPSCRSGQNLYKTQHCLVPLGVPVTR